MSAPNPNPADRQALIAVRNLTMAYGNTVIQRDLTFDVQRGEVLVVMGPSGCGKSTLLRHMVGLHAPAEGDIIIDGNNVWELSDEKRNAILRRCGVLYQSGALWTSMTLAENIGLPIREYTSLSRAERADLVSTKLALVGLAGYEDYYPAEISGGMRKRAGLARAMALDPDILFFDEPSAGLDPLSARRLDDLILEVRTNLNTTVVVVTHELASIFAIADNAVFLDTDDKTMIAEGPPRELLKHAEDPRVRRFLSRGRADDDNDDGRTDRTEEGPVLS